MLKNFPHPYREWTWRPKCGATNTSNDIFFKKYAPFKFRFDSQNFFLKAWPIGPRFTPAHSIVHVQSNFQYIFIFGCSLMETWTMDVCEGKSWSLQVPQATVSWDLHTSYGKRVPSSPLRDYLLSLVFAAIWQILRGGAHRFQSNQPKTRKCLVSTRDRTHELSVLSLLPYHLSQHASRDSRISCKIGPILVDRHTLPFVQPSRWYLNKVETTNSRGGGGHTGLKWGIICSNW